jgi:hypothetical protein
MATYINYRLLTKESEDIFFLFLFFQNLIYACKPNDILQIGLKAYDQLFYTQNSPIQHS